MKKKEIPALTKSGGLLSKFGGKKKVLEYRVWVHPKEGGDDWYYTADTLEEMKRIRKGLLNDKKLVLVEHPLAIVWDKKYEDFREVCIDGIDYEANYK